MIGHPARRADCLHFVAYIRNFLILVFTFSIIAWTSLLETLSNSVGGRDTSCTITRGHKFIVFSSCMVRVTLSRFPTFLLSLVVQRVKHVRSTVNSRRVLNSSADNRIEAERTRNPLRTGDCLQSKCRSSVKLERPRQLVLIFLRQYFGIFGFVLDRTNYRQRTSEPCTVLRHC